MANWCGNYITFKGGDIATLRKEFKKCIETNDKGFSWIPEGLSEDNKHIFYFDFRGDTEINDELCASFSSKWYPPIEALVSLADTFCCSFELMYEELGCLVYGRRTYDRGVMMMAELDDSELELVGDDEDHDFDRLNSLLMNKQLTIA